MVWFGQNGTPYCKDLWVKIEILTPDSHKEVKIKQIYSLKSPVTTGVRANISHRKLLVIPDQAR